jgi:hypothetical protein
VLADPATPPEGRFWLALTHGLHLIRYERRGADGLDLLRQVSGGAASFHPDASYVYYWLAQEAVKKGERAEAVFQVSQIRRAIGLAPGMKRHQEHLALAALIEKDLGIEPPPGWEAVDPALLARARECVRGDRDLI